MKYTVLWRPLAEEQLAGLWLDAADRAAITAAADRIDSLLRHDPGRVGESRSRSTRVLFVGPLVLVEVEEEDRVAYVTAVRLVRR